MFFIKSQRLRLVPLTIAQLQLLAQGRHELERVMNLTLSNFELNADTSFLQEFQMALDQFVIPAVQDHNDQYLWYTHWLIIEQSTNLTIGGIGVAGEPDENGHVMLGYFIDKKQEGKGMATEAVDAMLGWLLGHDHVKAIIADTPVEHKASQKVLEKNHFELLEKVDDGLRWIRLQ
jgi:RimJ/RimL family protein N-acetyltransferase